MAGKETSIAAGIVVFRPDPALLLPLIEAVAREAAPVFLLANGPLDPDLAARLDAEPVEVIQAPSNLGVAEGFNLCVLAALLRGKTRILLLDQDSRLASGMVAALSAAMDEVAAAGECPAVVGPRIVSPIGAETEFKAPRYFARQGFPMIGAAAPVHYVISSGSLVDLAAFRVVGPWRSDYFIDGVDTEWCFRAWSKGRSCWVARESSMEHRIGKGVIKAGLLGRAVPRQPDFRLFAYVRNQVYGLLLAHVPIGWKMRVIAHTARIVLLSWADRGFEPRFLAAMSAAMGDGLVGRLGPPPGAENAAGLDLVVRP